MVIIKSMRVEDYKKTGDKLSILYNFHETPFGLCLIGITNDDTRSICHMAFDEDKERGLMSFRKKWYLSQLIEEDVATKKVICRVFAKNHSDTNSGVCVLLKGTDFQLAVWRALTNIPLGSLTTYGKVADMIGKPRAVRAVANALASNQIGYLIPCHRIVGKNGSNKFSWGTDKKQTMQAFEADKIRSLRK